MAALVSCSDERTASLGEPLLKAVDLAELLNFSPATICDWAERDELPSFKIGGRLRFRTSEVAAWLEEHRS